MTKQLKVFVDSNVLLSASLGGTNDFSLFWDLPLTDILTSQFSIEEVSRNLKRAENRARLWQLIYRSHLVAEADLAIEKSSILLPAKDVPILAAALNAEADVLVSGDRSHFGPHWGKQVGSLMIESPRMFKSRFRTVFERSR